MHFSELAFHIRICIHSLERLLIIQFVWFSGIASYDARRPTGVNILAELSWNEPPHSELWSRSLGNRKTVQWTIRTGDDKTQSSANERVEGALCVMRPFGAAKFLSKMSCIPFTPRQRWLTPYVWNEDLFHSIAFHAILFVHLLSAALCDFRCCEYMFEWTIVRLNILNIKVSFRCTKVIHTHTPCTVHTSSWQVSNKASDKIQFNDAMSDCV